MGVKTTLAGVCAFFLLLTILPLAAPQQAELPTWNVGDTWAMGARDVDLGPIFKALMEATPGVTANVSGKVSYFVIYKVEGEDAQHYRVSVTQGMEMDLSGTISGTRYGTTSSGSVRMSMVAKGDGNSYYTKDKLALAKGDMALNLTMDLSMDMGAMGSMDMRADMVVNISFTASPPLDIFNFPISVGESWTVDSDLTTTGRVTGKVTGKAEVMGTERSLDDTVDQQISETTRAALSMSCPGTVDVQPALTCYKIPISGTGAVPSGMLAPGVVLYYSPDKRFVAASDVTFGGAMGAGALRSITTGPIDPSKVGDQPFLSARPVSEQEARSAIEAMGAKGINLVLVAVVVIIIIVVVIAAIVVIKRRRGAEAQPYGLLPGGSGPDF